MSVWGRRQRGLQRSIRDVQSISVYLSAAYPSPRLFTDVEKTERDLSQKIDRGPCESSGPDWGFILRGLF